MSWKRKLKRNSLHDSIKVRQHDYRRSQARPNFTGTIEFVKSKTKKER